MLGRKKLSLMISLAIFAASIGSVTTLVNAKPINNGVKDRVVTSKVDNSEKKKLTIMMYMDADNNLESSLLQDIQEMKQGYVENDDMNVIVLIDRTPGYSSNSRVLGSNFTDTRLYKVGKNKVERISGGEEFKEITKTSRYEANLGDANTLKKFINSCKSNYPAEKYMLLMSNHGGGAKDHNSQKNLNKAICWDDSSNDDCLYTGEISDCLGKEQSVDILTFDACLMGTAEIAYQFRPGNGSFEANTLVASSPLVWGNGLPYKNIFQRLQKADIESKEDDITLGGKEKTFDPAKITDSEMGALIVEEQRDSVNSSGETDQSFSSYDLTKSSNVKKSVDILARSLSKNNEKDALEKLRGTGDKTNVIEYFDERDETDWISYPYFDLYDLAEKISKNKSFSDETKDAAKEVMNSTDSMVEHSFAQSDFKGFKDGKNGVSIFLPDGGKMYADPNSGSEIEHWKMQRWYNSEDTMAKGLKTPYGKLSWCIDGIYKEYNKVGNWFELLDSFYDTNNDKTGGFNAYRW